jgi:outer membrane protein assembly factor BamB
MMRLLSAPSVPGALLLLCAVAGCGGNTGPEAPRAEPSVKSPAPVAARALAEVPRWPQFRGPDALGVAPDGMKFPTQFGPSTNVLWKTPLPSGYSSPCLWGDRIFLTGFDEQQRRLETLCLDRGTGRILWRQPAPAAQIEQVHKVSSPATATPATDGERVYAYFGSYGLLCYDFDGKQLWTRPLPVPMTAFGTGTSPVVAGGRVLLKCQGRNAALLALDPRSGQTVWQHNQLPFDPGYSLPCVRRQGDATEVVIHGELGVKAYDLKDGKERWSLDGLFGSAIPTPIAAEGLLFIVSQFSGGDQGDRLKMPSFDELLEKYDKNKDGVLSPDEIPPDLLLYSRDPKRKEGDISLLSMFNAFDMNRDGFLDRNDWRAATQWATGLENGLLAIRTEGEGGAVRARVVWKEKKYLPEVPTPLAYHGRLYVVKNGGFLSCLEAATGKLLYRERLGEGGIYYASPVAGDGKVYVASESGVVVVCKDGEKFEVLERNDLDEPIKATPALADGKIYLRTATHLYAFGE